MQKMSREDIEKDLNQILLEKMSKEYDEFIEKLSLQSPDEIIRASYEKIFKEDILAVVESRELEPKYVKALLRENYPLEGCYQRWLEEDVTYMEDLRICIEDHAKGLLRYMDKERER